MATKKKQPREPLIDLSNNIYVQVNGEEEKLNIIDWDTLKNIGDNLQNLITTIAKYSSEQNVIRRNDVKLKFTGFFKGSAVPAFKIENSTPSLFPAKDSIKKLSAEFSSILGNVEKGNFQAIADQFNIPIVKNDVIDAVYGFTNSAGTKQLQIVRMKQDGSFAKVRKIRPMKPEIRSLLKANPPNYELFVEAPTPVEAVAKIIIKQSAKGRTSKKATKFYTDKDASLVIKFDTIETNKRLYVLRDNISFDLIEEKKFFMLENKLLDIYAAGKTLSEAKDELYLQFDYTYQRLGSLPDEQLSEHLKNAKKYILFIVEQVKER